MLILGGLKFYPISALKYADFSLEVWFSQQNTTFKMYNWIPLIPRQKISILQVQLLLNWLLATASLPWHLFSMCLSTSPRSFSHESLLSSQNFWKCGQVICKPFICRPRYMHLTYKLSSKGRWVSFLNKIMLLSRIVGRAQWLPLIGVSSPECMNTRGPVWETFLVKIQSPKALDLWWSYSEWCLLLKHIPTEW